MTGPGGLTFLKVLTVKAEVKKALRALAFSVSFVIRFSALFNTRTAFSLFFVLLLIIPTEAFYCSHPLPDSAPSR